jgi:hypothetical protein
MRRVTADELESRVRRIGIGARQAQLRAEAAPRPTPDGGDDDGGGGGGGGGGGPYIPPTPYEAPQPLATGTAVRTVERRVQAIDTLHPRPRWMGYRRRG